MFIIFIVPQRLAIQTPTTFRCFYEFDTYSFTSKAHNIRFFTLKNPTT